MQDFIITWDETIRHEVWVEAENAEEALELWGTGLMPSDSWTIDTSDPIVAEA